MFNQINGSTSSKCCSNVSRYRVMHDLDWLNVGRYVISHLSDPNGIGSVLIEVQVKCLLGSGYHW